MPAIGSIQHVALQMEAEKELGNPKALNVPGIADAPDPRKPGDRRLGPGLVQTRPPEWSLNIIHVGILYI